MAKKYYKVPAKNIDLYKKEKEVDKYEKKKKLNRLALANLQKEQYKTLGSVARTKAKINYLNELFKRKPVVSIVNIVQYWLRQTK